MNESVIAPLYLQIALDIATRIAQGELAEKSKIYGRSVMSSEYGVSPETIRRSLKLLSDMDVLDIKQSSGAVVLSRKNAQEYIDRFMGKASTHSLHVQLKNLVAQQNTINKQIMDLTDIITRTSVKWSRFNPFENFEINIDENSPVVGKSISELSFWHSTGATIIAIRRNDTVILSPGPYATISANDTLIFIGDQSAVNAVNMFVSNQE